MSTDTTTSNPSTTSSSSTPTTEAAPTRPSAGHSLAAPEPARVRRAIGKRHFGTLATVSPLGRPHVAGCLYQLVDEHLYISTDRSSRKGRNIAANPHVAVAIPIRRLPVGPPSLVHFQATAEILAVDDPDVRALVEAGRLDEITGHGELDRPDGCIVRVTPPARLHTFGLGMSLLDLLRHPLEAAGATSFPG